MEERTVLQKVKAAHAFYGLEKEDQSALWGGLSEDEREVVLKGSYAQARAEAGLQERYERLSDDQQKAVYELEKAGHKHVESGSITAAAKAMEGMSEEEFDQIRGVLVEEGKRAFEEAQEKAKQRDKGRERGGWGRGR